jgi:hypothetical protein
MVEQQLFPDLALVMAADLSHVVKHLLPPRLKAWRERRERRRTQLQLARDLKHKLQVSQWEFSVYLGRVGCSLNEE